MWSVSTLDLDTLNKLSGVPDVRVEIVRDVLHGEHLAVLLRLLVLRPEGRIRLGIMISSQVTGSHYNAHIAHSW